MSKLFFVILRTIAIPVVMIWLLQNSFLGEQGAFLAVTLTLTIANFFSILFQLLKIFGNTLMLKGGKVIILTLIIIIEVASVVGFWVYYLSKAW